MLTFGHPAKKRRSNGKFSALTVRKSHFTVYSAVVIFFFLSLSVYDMTWLYLDRVWVPLTWIFVVWIVGKPFRYAQCVHCAVYLYSSMLTPSYVNREVFELLIIYNWYFQKGIREFASAGGHSEGQFSRDCEPCSKHPHNTTIL